MKKILMSVATLALVAAVVGGTTAMFSDTETAEANVTTAGSVTLLINDITHTYMGDPGNAPTYNDNGVSFTLDDIKPLDNGEIDYQVLNGQNEAYVCAMVTETANADNTVVNPELDLGDDALEGELQDFLSFQIGSESGLLSEIGGQWMDVGVVSALTPTNSVIEYCFGEFDGGGNCALGAGDENLAQTDSVTMDIDFYAVQTRNNEDFTCADLNGIAVAEADLALSVQDVIDEPTSWLFYNDSNDTIMTINQFAVDGGQNEFGPAAGSNGAALMTLDSNAPARYNIATYQFASTPAADIDSLKYRAYDASASGERPFLHFNVSFDGVDSWQQRLVFVPGASTNPDMTVDTWEVVDAIAGGAGMWTWSGFAGTWPAQPGTPLPDDTATYQSWSDLVAAYPSLQVRDTDSFFGVRVGHPGPTGEENYVDWIEFDGQQYDFVY